MKRIANRHQTDLVSILATLVTGLDEDETADDILNYLDTVGRHALLTDESRPLEEYVIVRIGDDEDGDRCDKWIRRGSVTAHNEVQAMSFAKHDIGSVCDGYFAVRAADWSDDQTVRQDTAAESDESEIDDSEPDDNVLIALTLLVVNPGVRSYLEQHDPALLRQARNALFEATGLKPIDDQEGGDLSPA
jgi:hypothetical protein